MKRQDLEKYLGKTVTVDIGAGRFFTGCLSFYFLSSNVNAFDCVSWIFRCSHVKKIKLLN